jgi:prepilin-type N-terminal cleavage/methylation domain-containing protein
MNRRLANNRGFTLVELMVAAVFVSVAGYSLSIMLHQGRSMINETRHRILVLNRLQSQMERLQLIKTVDGTVSLNENRNYTDTLILHAPDGSYVIPLDVEVRMTPSQQTNGSGYPAYYDISIVYSWNEKAGENPDYVCAETLKCYY